MQDTGRVMEFQGKIKEKIKEVSFNSVESTQSLIASGLLDSITLVDLAVALESEFRISIPFNEVNPEHFETVESIEKLIRSKIKAG